MALVFAAAVRNWRHALTIFVALPPTGVLRILLLSQSMRQLALLENHPE
jgi:hypothetical protein